MGKRAPFGRPGVPDRLRSWWHGKQRPSRVNTLIGLAVGGIAVGLVVAALSRDTSPSTGLANATRPQLGDNIRTPSTVDLDLRAVGGVVSPLGVPDQSSTTSTSIAPAPTVATSRPATASPAPSTTRAPVVTTIVQDPGVVYTEIPGSPTPSMPPTTPTTAPPSTAPPSTTSPTAPPTTRPPSATPTTAVTLLPPLPDLTPLLPLP